VQRECRIRFFTSSITITIWLPYGSGQFNSILLNSIQQSAISEYAKQVIDVQGRCGRIECIKWATLSALLPIASVSVVTHFHTVHCSAQHFFPENYFELFRVHVHHTGRVRWWFGGVMETSCHLDGTLFPFDSQSCSIVVQSWAYSKAFVDLKNTSSVVHLEEFEGNGRPSVRS